MFRVFHCDLLLKNSAETGVFYGKKFSENGSYFQTWDFSGLRYWDLFWKDFSLNCLFSMEINRPKNLGKKKLLKF